MRDQPIAFYGKIDDMIAEVGAFDMGAAWFKECGYRYAVLIDDGVLNYDTEWFPTKSEAKERVREIVKQLGAKSCAV